MKKLVLVFCLSLLIFCVPNVNAETITETRHLGNSLVYSILGSYSYSTTFKENLTMYDSFANVTRNFGGSYDGNIKIGVRVFQYTYDSNYDIIELNQELTNGTQQINGELDNEFEGYVSGNISIIGMNLSRLDGFMIGFYARVKQSATLWSVWTSLLYPDSNTYFVSESLTYDEIVTSNWNFTVYVKNVRVYTTVWTRKVNICFGNSTYDSRISNIQLADSITSETEQYMTLAILGLACGVIALGVMVVFKK